MVEGGLEGSAVTCCRGARCNPSFRLNTRKEVSCRTIGVTLITQCLLWDCLVLDVCVRVCARSQNGARAHLMIKDALIPQRYKTKIYNPARLLQKKKGGKKRAFPPLEHCVSAEKNPNTMPGFSRTQRRSARPPGRTGKGNESSAVEEDKKEVKV